MIIVIGIITAMGITADIVGNFRLSTKEFRVDMVTSLFTNSVAVAVVIGEDFTIEVVGVMGLRVTTELIGVAGLTATLIGVVIGSFIARVIQVGLIV